MSDLQIFLILSGIVLTILAGYICFTPKTQTRVSAGKSGAQEVAVTVKNGYSPDVIIVRRGSPVRFTFIRPKNTACSEEVIFTDFNKHAALAEGEEVMLEFPPEKSGEYEFHCQIGMLPGKLIVE
jgi:plastocyanin domain-containing protein